MAIKVQLFYLFVPYYIRLIYLLNRSMSQVTWSSEPDRKNKCYLQVPSNNSDRRQGFVRLFFTLEQHSITIGENFNDEFCR